MSTAGISQVIKETPELANISPTIIRNVQYHLGFASLPPITTFPLDITQKAVHGGFGTHHVRTETTWIKTVLTDESSILMGDRLWLWRWRAETGRGVAWITTKIPPKVMTFAGIGSDLLHEMSNYWRLVITARQRTILSDDERLLYNR
jgi:hypothetical protein